LTPKNSEKEIIFKNEKVMVTVLAIDLQFSKNKSQTPDQVSPFTYIRYTGNFLENSDI
jgi:hypothetical protein